ncbi:MAG: FAD-dependent oxidoreductase [Gammaproteobacteria bacterium]|nr:FAD-dependent oxidoreductase [Gammaproteobacteria bacterium]
MSRSHIAVCGAGLAGIATAYYLAIKYRQDHIVLIDKLQPMSLTTSKSGENFRELWPQTCMTLLMRHSLDLMQALADENDNVFNMRNTGYDFVSQSSDRNILPSWQLADSGGPGAAVRLTDLEEIRAANPSLSGNIRQIVRVKHAGAIDVNALGYLLLTEAKRAGVEVRTAAVQYIKRTGPSGFCIDVESGTGTTQLNVDKLVIAAGPFVSHLAGMLGIELPVESIPQRKFVIPDPCGVIPRDMPFTIFADPQFLNWSDKEKRLISADPEFRWLLEEFPAGLHIKPESRQQIKLGWAYNRERETPKWAIPDDVDFPNVVMRGASRFIPALSQYIDKLPTPVVQFAGYYTRTRENWPIIGPLEGEGVYTVAALSGYGTMAACGAGELCADWIMGERLPSYARNFHPERYGDESIKAEIDSLESDGQL